MPFALPGAVAARRRGGAPLWSPASIPGLALWFDADDASSFEMLGDTVNGWYDKSGNGRHALDRYGSVSRELGAQNGRAGVKFPDTFSYIMGNWSYTGENLSYFVVCKADTTAGMTGRILVFGDTMQNAMYDPGDVTAVWKESIGYGGFTGINSFFYFEDDYSAPVILASVANATSLTISATQNGLLPTGYPYVFDVSTQPVFEFSKFGINTSPGSDGDLSTSSCWCMLMTSSSCASLNSRPHARYLWYKSGPQRGAWN